MPTDIDKAYIKYIIYFIYIIYIYYIKVYNVIYIINISLCALADSITDNILKTVPNCDIVCNVNSTIYKY